MKLILFGLFYWFTLVVAQSDNINLFVLAINALLVKINEPLKITAMVCWSFDQKLKFFKQFNNNSREFQLSITQPSVASFPDVQDEHQYLIIVDLDCKETLTLMTQVGFKLTNRFKWIVLKTKTSYNDEIESVIEQRFQSLPVLVNSAVYIMYTLMDDIVHIKQIYRISLATSLSWELVGYYKNGSLFDYQVSNVVSQRRRNLQGHRMRASMVVTDRSTLDHLEDYRDKHIDTLTKVNYMLTNYLISYVNSTITYKVVNSWGYMNSETGQWSGMIGDLVENVSDIGASAMFLTSDRVSYIEFIAMPTPTSSKFVFRQPKLSFTDDVYTLPFDTFVWYSLAGLVVVVIVFFAIATRMETRMALSNADNTDANVLHASILDISILVLGAACQQGSSVTPRSTTARIIMLITFTTLMFLYAGYSAYIVALLQSPSNKIRTLEDLLNSRLKFGVHDTVFNQYYFRHSTEPIRKKIYELKIVQKDGSENFMNLEDGVARMREGLFAFHMELGVGYKVVSETFLEDEKCGLREIKYLQVADETWYAIQKNSSFKELLKSGMMKLHEYGLRNRENSAFYTKKPKCSGGGGNFITVGLVDTRSALCILVWGFGVSILILLMEKFNAKYQIMTTSI